MLNLSQRRFYGSPPASVERERALSICDDNSFGRHELLEQSGFYFFKLPLEVREMIYVELLPFERIYILLIDSKLVCDWEAVKSSDSVPSASSAAREQEPRPRLNLFENSQTPALTDLSTGTMHERQRNTIRRKYPGIFSKFRMWGVGILPLMQTCRKVYSDVVPYLYSRPTFAFHDTVPFLAFAASIPPSHFQYIRSVELGFAYPYALPALPRFLVARIKRAKVPTKTIPRPEACTLDYSMFYDGSFPAPLYNASIFPSQVTDTHSSSYMWDAIANALVEMKSLRKVRVTLLNIPRSISVLTEKSGVDSGQRDAQDIMESLRWVGRARPWKGEIIEADTGKETEVVFENVWWSTDMETKHQGHWVREVHENGTVDWREVGEAAGLAIELH